VTLGPTPLENISAAVGSLDLDGNSHAVTNTRTGAAASDTWPESCPR
jgi:hypothetical protein